jgi:hypothetical protein
MAAISLPFLMARRDGHQPGFNLVLKTVPATKNETTFVSIVSAGGSRHQGDGQPDGRPSNADRPPNGSATNVAHSGVDRESITVRESEYRRTSDCSMPLQHWRPQLGRRGAVYGQSSFRRSGCGSLAKFDPSWSAQFKTRCSFQPRLVAVFNPSLQDVQHLDRRPRMKHRARSWDTI